MICRANNNQKIVLHNYDDYNNVMIEEREQFEKMDQSTDRSDAHLDKVKKYCGELVTELHTMSTVSIKLLLSTVGLKWKDNSYRKFSGALEKRFS